MKVLLAIPCYRCAAQVVQVLAGFDEGLRQRLNRVVVIDNNSPDATVRVATEFMAERAWPGFSVLRNLRNFGLGGTFKVAVELAQREGLSHLVFLHGDHQVPTAFVHRCLDEAETHPYAAACLGARFMPGARLIGYSKLREYGNRGLNTLFGAVLRRPVPDLGSGLTMYRLSAFVPEGLPLLSDGLTFDLDLLLFLLLVRHEEIRFFPIDWYQEGQRSNAGNLAVGLQVLRCLLGWRYGRGPSPAVPIERGYEQVWP